jgi:hypothetical protein
MPGKLWTPLEDSTLIALCDRGAPLTQIMRTLGRPRNGINRRMKILRIRRVHKPQGVHTANGVAQLLGKAPETVIRWMEAANLPHRKVIDKAAKYIHYRVGRLDLIDWLADPINWNRYDVERISDALLRDYLRDVQRTAHNPYLTIPQIAERYMVAEYTVQNWLTQRRLTNCNPMHGHALIHEDELATFTPPHLNRAKRGTAKARVDAGRA